MFYNAALGFLTGQQWNIFQLLSMKIFYLPPPLPQNFAFCAKSTFLVAKLQGILLFGINYSFQIKYFIKKVKQNVQFMHAVA